MMIKIFEEIKHTDENGVEFWYARELMKVLEYTNWRNFNILIEKAKQSLKSTEINVLEHFDANIKTIQMPKGVI